MDVYNSLTCTYVVYSRHKSIKGVCYEDTSPPHSIFLRGHRNINALRYALAAAITCVCACCMLFPFVSNAVADGTTEFEDTWYSSNKDDYTDLNSLTPKKDGSGNNQITAGSSTWHLVPNDAKTEYTLVIKAPETYAKPDGSSIIQTFYGNGLKNIPWQIVGNSEGIRNTLAHPITKVKFVKSDNGKYNIVWLNNANNNGLFSFFEDFKTVKEFDMSGLAVLDNDTSTDEKDYTAQQMFKNCASLEDLSKITWPKQNKNNVTGDAYINSPSEDNLETFNWRHVNNIQSIFEGCTNLKKADLSGFAGLKFHGSDPSSAMMFKDCSNIESITFPAGFQFKKDPSFNPKIGLPIMENGVLKKQDAKKSYDFWTCVEINSDGKKNTTVKTNKQLVNYYSDKNTKNTPSKSITWNAVNYSLLQLDFGQPNQALYDHYAKGRFPDGYTYNPSPNAVQFPGTTDWWLVKSDDVLTKPADLVYDAKDNAHAEYFETSGWGIRKNDYDHETKWDFSKTYKEQTNGARKVTLVVQSRWMHLVKFMVDENLYSIKKLKPNEKIPTPKDPQKAGFKFDGWYWGDGDTKWPFDRWNARAGGETTVLKAHWKKATQHKVSFVAGDGASFTGDATVTVDDGAKVTKPAQDPTKQGFTFAGWFNGDTEWKFDSDTVKDDVTLTAHWTKTTTPDPHGGSGSGSGSGAGAGDSASASGNELVMMYRLYNPYSHEHLFTIDSLEKDKLASIGWNFEGSVGKVGTHGEKGGVYRLYNKTSGEHHYTMDEDEVARCVKAGWINEGVKFFSVDDGELAMYSMYNPYEKEFYHHYTSDADEMTKMVHDGWRKETIKWQAAK